MLDSFLPKKKEGMAGQVEWGDCWLWVNPVPVRCLVVREGTTAAAEDNQRQQAAETWAQLLAQQYSLIIPRGSTAETQKQQSCSSATVEKTEWWGGEAYSLCSNCICSACCGTNYSQFLFMSRERESVQLPRARRGKQLGCSPHAFKLCKCLCACVSWYRCRPIQVFQRRGEGEQVRRSKWTERMDAKGLKWTEEGHWLWLHRSGEENESAEWERVEWGRNVLPWKWKVFWSTVMVNVLSSSSSIPITAPWANSEIGREKGREREREETRHAPTFHFYPHALHIPRSLS